MKKWCFLALASAITVAGCGDDDGDTMDGDASVEDGGPRPFDAGPPEPCDSPGSLESVSCGACGSVERFCTAAGVWSYGLCEGEGMCVPGSTMDIPCDNCGTQPARCTTACTWEITGECEGGGVCEPGARTRNGTGCAAGETREVVCSDACMYEPAGECESDECTSPGALETVACGNCGSQQRFCTASGVWEYDGGCTGEGECTPGTTEDGPCGMCGTTTRRCTVSCMWEPTGTCSGEGTCLPGTTQRTSAGCPAGQTRELTCNDACTLVDTSPCETTAAKVDVMLLLDVTGSQAGRLDTNVTTLVNRFVQPLLAAGDVAVGASYYADFSSSVGGPGGTGDVPFEGGIEPSTNASAIQSELSSSVPAGGGDTPESGVEALYILSGGAPHSAAIPLPCSAGRPSGGCWRTGSKRVVVIYTDAPNHNGPDSAGTGVYSPYAASLGAASWVDTKSRLLADGTRLLFLFHRTGSNIDALEQSDRMLSDMGEPASHRINSEADFGAACDTAVSRIRAITGL